VGDETLSLHRGQCFITYEWLRSMSTYHKGASVRSQRKAPCVLTVSRSASNVLFRTSLKACVDLPRDYGDDALDRHIGTCRAKRSVV